MRLHSAAAALLLPLASWRSPPLGMMSSSPLVIHEGDGWLVANKPSGVTVHDGENSLVALLADAGFPEYKPCHRLDADTSGAMLLATREKAGAISACLAGATKLYRAVVKGEFTKKTKGIWKQSLSPKAEGRKNPLGIAASRVPATTAYEVKGYDGFVSLVDFTLSTTGRTHQIRKHAAANGHPIAGDARYAEPWAANQMVKRYQFSGMALHAAALAITIEGTEHTFEAPLPEVWLPLIASFESGGDESLAVRAPVHAPVRVSAAQPGAGDLAPPAAAPVLNGVCSSWNLKKGFGFIKGEQTLENVYVHQRSVVADGFRSLKEGERVEYVLSEMADGKLECVRVTGPNGGPVIGQPRPAAPTLAKHVAKSRAAAASAGATQGGATKGKPRLATGAAKQYKKAKDAGTPLDLSKPRPPGAYPPKKPRVQAKSE